jgi:hypothetical protein
MTGVAFGAGASWARRALMVGGAAALVLGGAARAEPPARGGPPPDGAATPDPMPQAQPQRIGLLFCGDSLAQGLFLTLAPVVRRHDSVRAINGTQHATGVTRGDEHDWVSVSRDLVARHRPQLVVFWIGANDFRPFVQRAQRARHQFGTPGFVEAYRHAVAEMAGAAVDAGAKAVWLGLPNMRDPQMAGAARTLNEIQQAGATSRGATFIPTWEATSDGEGRYLPVSLGQRPLPFRAEDGVHFTDHGYRRVAAMMFDRVAQGFPDLAAGLAAPRRDLA